MILGAAVPPDHAKTLSVKAAEMRLSEHATDEDLLALRSRFEELGIMNAQIGAYCNLSSTDEAIRQENIQHVRQAMRVAHLAGCKNVVVGGGHRDPSRPRETASAHIDNWTDHALDVLADSCLQVLDGLDFDVHLVIETWVMTPVSSEQRALQLANKVNHPKMGILFDPVNCMNIERYFQNGDFMRRFVETVGDKIFLVHLKDTFLRARPITYHMSEVPIGEGNLDYPALLRAIDPLPVPALLEHMSNPDDYGPKVEYIRNLAGELGIDL
ncbi:sugar phosphate isomerase/epimerase family protein [Alicyclobacillus acidiphilus]|uniref:sugar phosphate isomerase/epimerase family protein n=1 Tax=Alicyclobacillus acidiphilus TaxID=182455 RepID=UPI00082BB00A|nr:sugar phosphate isomerase/epimerase family protein [Alicyclobacillus acidiphilus]